MTTGVIVLGHGSRVSEANDGLDLLVEMVRAKVQNFIVETAFMSQANPSLPEAIAKLAAEKVEKIIIVPLFLFAGAHVRQDVPEMVEMEKEKYQQQIEIILTSNLGTDPRIAEIVIDRIREAS